MPATRRPLLTRCAVENELASVAAGRSVARATSVPTRTRLVSAATAPEQTEALERRAPVGRVAPPHVVVDEHPVELVGLGRARDRDRDLGVLDERRQGRADQDRHGRRPRASTAAPIAPARSPSVAGTIAIAGR